MEAPPPPQLPAAVEEMLREIAKFMRIKVLDDHSHRAALASVYIQCGPGALNALTTFAKEEFQHSMPQVLQAITATYGAVQQPEAWGKKLQQVKDAIQPQQPGQKNTAAVLEMASSAGPHFANIILEACKTAARDVQLHAVHGYGTSGDFRECFAALFKPSTAPDNSSYFADRIPAGTEEFVLIVRAFSEQRSYEGLSYDFNKTRSDSHRVLAPGGARQLTVQIGDMVYPVWRKHTLSRNPKKKGRGGKRQRAVGAASGSGGGAAAAAGEADASLEGELVGDEDVSSGASAALGVVDGQRVRLHYEVVFPGEGIAAGEAAQADYAVPESCWKLYEPKGEKEPVPPPFLVFEYGVVTRLAWDQGVRK